MTTEVADTVASETLSKSERQRLGKQVEQRAAKGETLGEKIGQAEAANQGQQPASGPVAAPSAPPPASAPAGEQVTPVPALLVKILSARRSHSSKGDLDFRMWLFNHLKADGQKPRYMQENIVVEVGNSKTLFSSHVDTCHSMQCSEGGAGSPQKLAYDPSFGHLVLDKEFAVSGNVLGADDGSGIYIMLRMIQAKIPGSYIFHVGEERGGIGSRALVANAEGRKWLGKFDRAVAFDRAGDCDVICTQGGQACASVSAGEQLAAALVGLGLKHMKVSHKGSFTDTKVYRDIIPECFNLSVGYRDQHGPNESQDVPFLEALVEACLKINWDNLKVARDPSAKDTYGGYGTGGGGYGGSSSQPQRRLPYEDLQPTEKTPTEEITPKEFVADLEAYNFDAILEIVENDPEFAAKAISILYAKLRAAESYGETLDTLFA